MPSNQDSYAKDDPQFLFDQYRGDPDGYYMSQAPRHRQKGDHTFVPLPPAQVEQQTLRVGYPWSPRRAHRLNHVIDGRLHVVNAAIPLSTGATSAQPSDGDTREHDNHSLPLTADRNPAYQHNPALRLLENSSRERIPAHRSVPRLETSLSDAPLLRKLDTPDAKAWSLPIDPLQHKLRYDELFFVLDAPYSLPQQAFKKVQHAPNGFQKKQPQPPQTGITQMPVHELPGDVPYHTLHHPEQPNTLLLTSRSYILQHGTDAQLAVLDARQDAEDAPECLDTTAASRKDSTVPQELASGASLFPTSGKQEGQGTPVYAHFMKMRKWDYEELEGTYNEVVNGLAIPPSTLFTKNNGGFDWFYGGRG